MRAKPIHLGPSYGAQFGDAEIVQAYRHRPPYPPAIVDVLSDLVADPRPRVLEIGAGSGDLTAHVVAFAGHVDAVEPAAAMGAAFRARGFDADAVRLIEGDAETALLEPPYDLAVAGESLHWTEWSVALPRIGAALHADAYLAIVARTQAPLPCEADVRRLIARFSTNRDYAPYDLLEELGTRGLFTLEERVSLPSVVVRQTIDEVVESMHSRNGFSRARMTDDAAVAFDRAFAALLLQHYPKGQVRLDVGASVAWGRPGPAPRT